MESDRHSPIFKKGLHLTERFNRSAIHYAFDTPNPLNDAAKAQYAKSPIPELPADQFRAMFTDLPTR